MSEKSKMVHPAKASPPRGRRDAQWSGAGRSADRARNAGVVRKTGDRAADANPRGSSHGADTIKRG